MTEHRFFTDDVAHVSTFAFHEHRERAPHLEQDVHRPRLEKAAELLRSIASRASLTLSDLGCGDGGLLSLVQRDFYHAWGYDFAPANAAGWAERGVEAQALDVFGVDRGRVVLGDVVAMTEVLEHLTHPREVLGWLRTAYAQRVRYLVLSSPWNETPESHCGEHAWAWDEAGYEKLLYDTDWLAVAHERVGGFQVVLAI